MRIGWLITLLLFVLAARALDYTPLQPAVYTYTLDKLEVDLISAQAFAAYCGGALSRAGTAGRFTLTRDGRTFVFAPGWREALDNGAAVSLDLAPIEEGGHVLVPALPLAKALGGTVEVRYRRFTLMLPGLAAPLALERDLRFCPPEQDTPRNSAAGLYIVPLGDSATAVPRRLSYNPEKCSLPAVAADGTLTYIAVRQSTQKLVRRRADEKAETLLYEGDPNDHYSIPLGTVRRHRWGPMTFDLHPDGRTVLFNETFDEGAYLIPQKPSPRVRQERICLLRAGEDAPRILGEGERPRFSPDGMKIGYEVSARQQVGIDVYADWTTHVMDADGNNTRPVGPGRIKCFSPDGRTLACTLGRDGGTVLCLYRLDGDFTPAVTSRAAAANSWDEYPCFTPDGKRVVFVRDYRAIWIMNVDGTQARPLVEGLEWVTQPVFAPDGSLLFGARTGLYRLGADLHTRSQLVAGLAVAGCVATPDRQVIFRVTGR